MNGAVVNAFIRALKEFLASDNKKFTLREDRSFLVLSFCLLIASVSAMVIREKALINLR